MYIFFNLICKSHLLIKEVLLKKYLIELNKINICMLKYAYVFLLFIRISIQFMFMYVYYNKNYNNEKKN